jgi:superfamily II DNA or RNA helicase
VDINQKGVIHKVEGGMLIKIRDNKIIHVEGITTTEEQLLRKWFSARNPAFRYIRGIMPGVSYDGVVCRYNAVKRTLPLTFKNELRTRCAQYDIKLTIIDERQRPKYAADPDLINEDWLPGIKLNDYQIDSIKAACVEECGILCLPTGSGKGELIAGIVKAYKCPTVILAEQVVIIDQLKERLELRDVVEEVGLFYAGTTPDDKLVCIGTSSSLLIPPLPTKFKHKPTKFLQLMKARQTRSENAMKYRDLLKKADLLIVDECDRAVSKTYKHMFRHWFNGRRRFGMSATPFDRKKPIENLFVREHFGSIIHEVHRDVVEQSGRIIPIKFYMIAIGEDGYKFEGSTWDIALKEQVIENGEFHQTVKGVVESFKDDGTLILVERDELGKMLESIIENSVFINGQTPKKQRRNVIDRFEKREIKCLIGGKILKRGFDLKGGCENLILSGMGQLHSDLLQQIGRAFRLNSKGKARVFDFYFMNNKYLYGHSKERLKAVVNSGYDATVIFKNKTISGLELIKRKFRI